MSILKLEKKKKLLKSLDRARKPLEKIYPNPSDLFLNNIRPQDQDNDIFEKYLHAVGQIVSFKEKYQEDILPWRDFKYFHFIHFGSCLSHDILINEIAEEFGKTPEEYCEFIDLLLKEETEGKYNAKCIDFFNRFSSNN